MAKTPEFESLQTYVDCANTLADCVRKDIRLGGEISPNTLAALNAFVIAANNVQYLLEPVTKDKKRQH